MKFYVVSIVAAGILLHFQSDLSSQKSLLQVHPGTISTNLMRHQSWLQWAAAIAPWIVGLSWILGLKTSEQGTSSLCVSKLIGMYALQMTAKLELLPVQERQRACMPPRRQPWRTTMVPTSVTAPL